MPDRSPSHPKARLICPTPLTPPKNTTPITSILAPRPHTSSLTAPPLKPPKSPIQPNFAPPPHSPQVARGLAYPLEIFMTPTKGWGVRCSVDLPPGAVLCRYIGLVITDRWGGGQQAEGGARTARPGWARGLWRCRPAFGGRAWAGARGSNCMPTPA